MIICVTRDKAQICKMQCKCLTHGIRALVGQELGFHASGPEVIPEHKDRIMTGCGLEKNKKALVTARQQVGRCLAQIFKTAILPKSQEGVTPKKFEGKGGEQTSGG